MTLISEFTTKTVARITGVTARQLDYWANTGFVVPSIQIGAGRGKVRLYSFVDLVQVKVARQLRDAGISLQKMRKAVNALRNIAPEVEKPLAQFELISDGREVYVADSEDRMVAITSGMGQFYWRLKVGELVRELVGQVEQMAHLEESRVEVEGRDYPVTIHQDLDSDWWVGQCPAIRGCVTQGRTREEVLAMLADAVAECLAAGSMEGPSAEMA